MPKINKYEEIIERILEKIIVEIIEKNCKIASIPKGIICRLNNERYFVTNQQVNVAFISTPTIQFRKLIGVKSSKDTELKSILPKTSELIKMIITKALELEEITKRQEKGFKNFLDRNLEDYIDNPEEYVDKLFINNKDIVGCAWKLENYVMSEKSKFILSNTSELIIIPLDNRDKGNFDSILINEQKSTMEYLESIN
jgi:hypothetical protein